MCPVHDLSETEISGAVLHLFSILRLSSSSIIESQNAKIPSKYTLMTLKVSFEPIFQ